MAKCRPLDETLWTLDQFLDWRETRPRDERWEFYAGVPLLKGTPLAPLPPDLPVMMSPERARHAFLKAEIGGALREKLKGMPCRAFVDGPQLRVGEFLYQPDVVVTCETIDWRSTEIREPVVIVEVLSASTEAYDKSHKLIAYRTLPSLRHYLLVAQDQRLLIHHARTDEHEWRERFIETGIVTLNPPGLTLVVDEVYADTGL